MPLYSEWERLSGYSWNDNTLTPCLMSTCKLGQQCRLQYTIQCTTENTKLISTHLSACSEWLVFRATAIVVAASADIPLKLRIDQCMDCASK